MSRETEFRYRTRGNSKPDGKPRVYFTCHPDDFGRYFDKICEDIFKTHDCAIFYTEDMSADLSGENNRVDLERMNLFVIPVTFRLLSRPNRAMDCDFSFAMEKHIPVLPIMMESGIYEFYKKPDKFGELQYLKPYGGDETAISYEDKLKKYLESVLISDELAKRIRKVFDAYIFLSYRKKDRAYANELIKLIHSDPEYRDIAIWFDEFLIPGESFKENIKRLLDESKLFALLVTPNLLEKPNGKPNFVMGEEYPAAQKSGKSVFPAEMISTDIFELRTDYENIPDPVNVHDEEEFRKRLAVSLDKIAKSENNNDPEHNYLIGLAYLEGIDVEVNTARGVELITSAAESDLPEAVARLYEMYLAGYKVKLDYNKALYWIQKGVDLCKREHGQSHPQTMAALNNLAYAYRLTGDYEKTMEVQEQVYKLQRKAFGKEHPDTLLMLNNLANAYAYSGNYEKALELSRQAYDLMQKNLGNDHIYTMNAISGLANIYEKLGDYSTALELAKKVYLLRRKVLGEEHPDTVKSLNNLAVVCRILLGTHELTLELSEKAYDLYRKNEGEEHPETLTTLNNMAYSCGQLGDHKKALELNKKVYEIMRRTLGEEHPETLGSLCNLAIAYGDAGDDDTELELHIKVYKARKKILGEEHRHTLLSLNNIAYFYLKRSEWQKAAEFYDYIYEIQRKNFGEDDTDTMETRTALIGVHEKLGNYKRMLELFETLYDLTCEKLGADHEAAQSVAKQIKELKAKTGE